jgi:hypothetical protein
MAKNLYVRVKPKGPVSEFHRCGIKHTLQWVLLADLDDATAERLQNEQMLETSSDKPADFDAQVETAEPAAEQVPVGLIGSDVLQAAIAYAGGFEITLGDLVQQAHTDSGLTVADWNGLPQAARNLILDGKLTQLYKGYVEANGLSVGLVEPAVAEFKTALEAKIDEVAALKDVIANLQSQLNPPGAATETTPVADAKKPASKTKGK